MAKGLNTNGIEGMGDHRSIDQSLNVCGGDLKVFYEISPHPNQQIRKTDKLSVSKNLRVADSNFSGKVTELVGDKCYQRTVLGVDVR